MNRAEAAYARAVAHGIATIADEEVVDALRHALARGDAPLAGDLATEATARMRRGAAVAESVSEAIVAVDPEGRVTFVNAAAERLLGVPRAALVGRDAHDAFHSRRADGTLYPADDCAHRAALETGVPGRLDDDVVVRADGGVVAVETSIAPFAAERGLAGAVLAFHDVTARKRREAERVARERRLAARNRAIVDLARRSGAGLAPRVRECLAAAARAMPVERSSVWLYTEDRSAIRCFDLYELTTDRHSEGMVLRSADYPSYFLALDEARVVAAHDALNDPRTREFGPGYLTPLGITSMLDAPIRVGGRLAGVLCHEHVGPARRWEYEDEAFAGAIADLIALAIQEAGLRGAF